MALRHNQDIQDASKAMGFGAAMGADIWSVTWTVFAAAAGLGLTVAAIVLWRRADQISGLEFDGGYNALAPAVDLH